MLLEFYKLREQPFGDTPDPRFLFFSSTHREAIASVFYAIDSGRGFSTVIAAPGMGKTTLLNHLHEGLKDNVRIIFFSQFDRTTRRLHESLMKALGITQTEHDTEEQLVEALKKCAASGERIVLIIDEAQNLDSSTLESVRLLSNLETPKSKLLHIILSGQPQLAGLLLNENLWQLRQRISMVCRLKPLTLEEVGEYVEHRLRVAGYKGEPIFTSDAIELIAECSRGIPRSINTVCANALSLACAKSVMSVTKTTVQQVMLDMDLAAPSGLQGSPSFVEQSRTEPEQAQGGQKQSPESTVSVAIEVVDDIVLGVRFPRNERAIEVEASPQETPKPAMISCLPNSGEPHLAFLAAAITCVVVSIGAAILPGRRVEHPQVFTLSPAPLSRAEHPSANRGVRKSSRGAQSTITVKVRPNDTLSTLSLAYFGRFDSQLAEQIYRLNPELDHAGQLQVGQRIRLPKFVGSNKPIKSATLVTEREPRKGESNP